MTVASLTAAFALAAAQAADRRRIVPPATNDLCTACSRIPASSSCEPTYRYCFARTHPDKRSACILVAPIRGVHCFTASVPCICAPGLAPSWGRSIDNATFFPPEETQPRFIGARTGHGSIRMHCGTCGYVGQSTVRSASDTRDCVLLPLASLLTVALISARLPRRRENICGCDPTPLC